MTIIMRVVGVGCVAGDVAYGGVCVSSIVVILWVHSVLLPLTERVIVVRDIAIEVVVVCVVVSGVNTVDGYIVALLWC